MPKTEYLSKDILDDAYIKCFAPFHYIQTALGTCRIDIRDRFVTSPTTLQKVFSIICAILTLILYIYVSKTYFKQFYTFGGIYYTAISSLTLYYITFLSNLIHIRFMNSKWNPKFYIQLQQIDRIMKVDQKYKLYKFLFVNNAISVGATVITLCLTFCITVYENFIYVLGFVGLLYSVITCTIEWIYCADLLVYFFLRMRFINAIIMNHLDGKVEILRDKSFLFPTYYAMRYLASDTHDFETSLTDDYLKALIGGFSVFQATYRFQIFVFCTQFVLLSLLSFETGILALQYNALRWSDIVTLPTILILNVVLALLICFRCELFFREAKKMRRLCITIMSRYCDGPLRKKAKTMFKVIEEHPGKFNVYNMWFMNALSVIKMLNLVTGIMVILLQFAYL